MVALEVELIDGMAKRQYQKTGRRGHKMKEGKNGIV